jgi:hypothetical protein
MFYYTHHSDMDTSRYAQVDVPLELSVAWKFYYIHHSGMDVP